jgi:DNA-directed RNA polymerase specialized sigma24 family protein
MWQAIYDGSDEKHFWEERFGAALKDKCLEIARSLNRKYHREDHGEVDLDDVSVQPFLSDGERQIQHGLGAIDAKTLLKAIQALPERQSQAAFLVWIEDRTIAGDSAQSVTTIMGISETAVHNLLSKARARLAASPIVRELRGDA